MLFNWWLLIATSTHYNLSWYYSTFDCILKEEDKNIFEREQILKGWNYISNKYRQWHWNAGMFDTVSGEQK